MSNELSHKIRRTAAYLKGVDECLDAGFDLEKLADDVETTFRNYEAACVGWEKRFNEQSSKIVLLEDAKARLAERLAEIAENRRYIGQHIETIKAFESLATKVVEWDDARRRFVDHGFMGDAHEADRMGVEIVADAKTLLSSSDAGAKS